MGAGVALHIVVVWPLLPARLLPSYSLCLQLLVTEYIAII